MERVAYDVVVAVMEVTGAHLGQTGKVAEHSAWACGITLLSSNLLYLKNF